MKQAAIKAGDWRYRASKPQSLKASSLLLALSLAAMVLAGIACFDSPKTPPPAPVAVGPPRPPAAQTPSVPVPPVRQTPGNGLVGTTWTIGDMTVTFKDGSTLWIKGGLVASLAPSGVEGAYTLAGQALEVNVMGNKKTGTFDGTKLSFEGKEAVRIEY